MTAHHVREFMSKLVVTVQISETLESVVGKMRAHGISGCPVLDEREKLVGVISEVDLARVLSLGRGSTSLAGFLETLLKAAANETLDPLAQLMHRFRHLRAGSCMSSPAITVGPEDPISRAAEIMGRKHINRLPVVQNGRVVGIIARTDLMRAILDERARSEARQSTAIEAEVAP
jgi:CBS domain-containing protein